MSYYSEYYLEEFQNDAIKQLTIILNRVETHSKQKYLLIVAKDLNTNKIIKLIDTHGAKHDLCKYSDDWAKLNKGDVISVKCEFYKSQQCANVLRIKSNYTLIETIDLHKELKKTEKKCFLRTYNPDLYFLSKKFSGKYGFLLFHLNGRELIEYKRKDSDKVKYQFKIGQFRNAPCYADIECFTPNIKERIGQFYTGFVLLQIAYKNDRIRAKVYELLGDENCFKNITPVWTDDNEDGLPF